MAFLDGGASAEAMAEAGVEGWVSITKAKRKRGEDEEDGANGHVPIRRGTLSIAVPGSIVGNAQSLELRTRLAGRIARAAAIFQVQYLVCVCSIIDWSQPNKRA